MRTQDEIVARVREIKALSFFGFGISDLLTCVHFERAKEFLDSKVVVTSGTAAIDVIEIENVKWPTCLPTDEDIKAEMANYIAFAWEKCEDHRGLSAERSVAHFQSWCWLIGDDEAVAFIEGEDNYAMYGAPILSYLCDRYGWAKPDTESTKNMMQGHPCSDGCHGCAG